MRDPKTGKICHHPLGSIERYHCIDKGQSVFLRCKICNTEMGSEEEFNRPSTSEIKWDIDPNKNMRQSQDTLIYKKMMDQNPKLREAYRNNPIFCRAAQSGLPIDELIVLLIEHAKAMDDLLTSEHMVSTRPMVFIDDPVAHDKIRTLESEVVRLKTELARAVGTIEDICCGHSVPLEKRDIRPYDGGCES